VPGPNQGQDSVLFVSFDYRKNETVFVQLNNLDIDTLSMAYQVVNAAPCCENYTNANPILLNNTYLEQM
jgi:hypothetical protein